MVMELLAIVLDFSLQINNGLNKVFQLLVDLGFKPYFEKPMIKENRKPLYVIHIRQNERERFLSLIKPVSKIPGNLRG